MTNYLRIEQNYFVWHRAIGGYCWDMDAESTGPGYKPLPPFLRTSDEATGFTPYRPLEEAPALFSKFAAAPINQEAILELANQYGHLTAGVSIRSSQRKGGLLALEGEAFEFWRYELQKLSDTLTLWEAIEAKDAAALGTAIRWENDCISYTTSYGSRSVIASKTYNNRTYERIQTGDVFLPAKYALLSAINAKLWGSISTRLLFNKQNDFVPYVVPKDLLAALWFQFFQAVTGERPFKRCKACGLWADVSNHRSDWTMHYSCANAARVRRSRARKKGSD